MCLSNAHIQKLYKHTLLFDFKQVLKQTKLCVQIGRKFTKMEVISHAPPINIQVMVSWSLLVIIYPQLPLLISATTRRLRLLLGAHNT